MRRPTSGPLMAPRLHERAPPASRPRPPRLEDGAPDRRGCGADAARTRRHRSRLVHPLRVGDARLHRRGRALGGLRAGDRLRGGLRRALAALQRRGVPALAAARDPDRAHAIGSPRGSRCSWSLGSGAGRGASFPRAIACAGRLASGLLILSEALIGAGLVLFGLVADDRSRCARLVLALHLTNTFLLLAALDADGTSAEPSGRHPARVARPRRSAGRWRRRRRAGASGSPAPSPRWATPSFPPRRCRRASHRISRRRAHLLVRLRVYHPLVAILVSRRAPPWPRPAPAAPLPGGARAAAEPAPSR